jgi:hypothetical protein
MRGYLGWGRKFVRRSGGELAIEEMTIGGLFQAVLAGTASWKRVFENCEPTRLTLA